MQFSIRRITPLLLLTFFLNLTACSSSHKLKVPTQLPREESKEIEEKAPYKGHYKIGKKYKIKGKTYTPKEDKNYNKVGIASWYGTKDGFHGKKTANGDRYNKRMLTAAHPKLPLPSLVKVTNLSNQKSVILMLNDRGPFVKNRIIDVSEKAAEILGFKKNGVAKIRVQYLHQETQDFLKNIALKPKENSLAKKKVATVKDNGNCSVNCHVKLVNLKYNLALTP